MNSTHTPVPSSNDTTDLELQDLLNEPTENEYVDDSGNDLEEMKEDEELTEIVNFVFGPESDEEDLGLCTHIYKTCHAYQGRI